jgi:protein SCO1
LIDTEGRPFSSTTLSGYYYLLYFGFTNCPEICPSALYYISTLYRVIRNIPEGAYLKLKIVFVSIDPERDSPKAVKEFLAHFNKNMIGVTASGPNDPELKEVMKKFKIYSKKIYAKEGEKGGKYNIDHTTRIYLMDP